MQNAASRTSPRDASPAVTLRRTLQEVPENSSPLLALTVARKLRFPSSPLTTDLFTAASATQLRDSNHVTAEFIGRRFLADSAIN